MKLLLLSAFVATIFYVTGAKKLRMAGMNGGMMPGMNGGVMPGMNGGMMVRGNPGMMGGGMMGGGMMAGGMNPPMVGGFMGQPQFAQVVPGMGAYAMQPQAFPAAPFGVPNMGPPQQFPGFPFMGIPQMGGVNPAQQQQVMGLLSGALQQQPAAPLRFKRHARPSSRQANSVQTAVDTQIPVPTETPSTTTPCKKRAP